MSLIALRTGPANAPDPLVAKIGQFWDDPCGYVLWAFPWGRGALVDYPEGPDTWQRAVMHHVRDQIRAGVKNIRVAVSSGHGVGKGALVAWLVLWFMSTRGDPQVVVTANTGKQLNTKTWREVAKWRRLAMNGHWFKWSATSLKHVGAPETWFASAIEWSEHNAEAFAGTHEEHVMYLFDEASGIARSIWETSEGAMTQPDSFWFVFGNPTKNEGRFRECWTKFRARWARWNLDSRDCRMSSKNREQHQEWINDYGEDSDFVRVRIKGQFPRVSSEQFIGTYLVEAAQARKFDRRMILPTTPRIMGIDPGAGGEETSAILCVEGAYLVPESIHRYSIADPMQLASRLAYELNQWLPDVAFIDAHGIGHSIYSRLVQLGYGDIVVPVYWGSTEEVSNHDIYYNQRIECWDRLRSWLASACIPYDVDLNTDLTAPLLLWDAAHRMRLEKKEDMRTRGVDSPHTADALALCFSYPVVIKRGDEEAGGGHAVEPPVG